MSIHYICHMDKKTLKEQIALNGILEEKMKTIDIRQKIADKLDQVTVKNGWSLRGLGIVSGVSDTTIRRILKCEQDIAVDKLHRICLAMGIKLSDFLQDIE